jgi:hypothetical protein
MLILRVPDIHFKKPLCLNPDLTPSGRIAQRF